jgi:FkbM family methyltransferase
MLNKRSKMFNLLSGKLIRYIGIALVSRRHFKNWFSAGVKYFLYKNNILNIKFSTLICRDGFIFQIPIWLYGILINGFYDNLFMKILCKEQMIIAKNSHIPLQELYVSNGVLDALLYGWKYDEKHRYWFKDNIKFKHMYKATPWVFYGLYNLLNVKNKIVIDVGAFVGDSAIYFALRGAKKVIAIEPHPQAYKEMLENIKLNNLENHILAINAGLASKPRKICIESVNILETEYTYHKPGRCKIEVSAITLNELLNILKDKDEVIIKMDCEGCEYDVIINDYAHVKMFKELLLEYHIRNKNMSASKLLAVLSKDFLCKIIKKGKNIGLVYCIKR